MASNRAVAFTIEVKNHATGELEKLGVEAKSVEEALKKISGAADKAARRARGFRKELDFSVISNMASQAIDRLSGAVSSLIEPYQSFETAMRKVNTMAGQDSAGLEQMTDKIAELSKTVPMAREQLADGLYQVISNGVAESDWMSYLEQSAHAAVGGIADLGQTVTVTSTMIKNYGLQWSAAGSIQDKIQTTAKNGVTSFEQLAAALPRVSGSAAQLGVSVDELMAVFATTTGVTGNTAEVSTQLAAVLNSLIKPTSEATKMAAAMGIQFDAAAVKAAGGFQNFLTQLDSTVQSYAASSGQLSQTIYGTLFGSAEALRLLGSLTGEQRDVFANNIAAMADSTGAIDAAFADMSSTGEAAAIMAQNTRQSMTDWIASIAQSAAPTIQFAASMGTAITTAVTLGSSMSAAMKAMQSFGMAAKVSHGASTVLEFGYKALFERYVALGSGIAKAVRSTQAYTLASKMASEISSNFRIRMESIAESAGKVSRSIMASVKSTRAYTVVTKIAGVISSGFAKVQKLLNGVLSANPIGAVIMALTLLAAMLRAAYVHCEGFRKFVDAAWAAIKRFAASAAELGKKIWDWLGRQFEKMANVVKKLWGYVKWLFGIKDSGNGTTAAVVSTTDAVEDLGDAANDTTDDLQDMINTAGQISAPSAKSTKSGSSKDLGSTKSDMDLGALSEEISVDVAGSLRNIDLAGTIRRTMQLKQALKDVNVTLSDMDKTANRVMAAVGGSVNAAAQPAIQLTAGVRRLGLLQDLNRLGQAGKDIKKSVGNSIGEALGGVSKILQNLTGAVGESAAAWLSYAANVLQSVSQMIPALMALAAAEAAAHDAKWLGWIGAAAAITATIAAFAAIPKFAKGGIAYGPTVGMFGEYAGASTNPEVVAPLSNLRQLLDLDRPSQGLPSVIRLVAHGRDLAAVIDTRKNYLSRT